METQVIVVTTSASVNRVADLMAAPRKSLVAWMSHELLVVASPALDPDSVAMWLPRAPR